MTGWPAAFAASSDDGETRRVRSRRASRHGFAAHASRTSDSISPASRSARAARRSASVSKWFFFPRTPSPVTHRSADAPASAATRIIARASSTSRHHDARRSARASRQARAPIGPRRDGSHERDERVGSAVSASAASVSSSFARSPVRQMRVHHAGEGGLRERRPLRLTPRMVALQEHVRRARPRAERRGRTERARHCARRRLVKKEKNRGSFGAQPVVRRAVSAKLFVLFEEAHAFAPPRANTSSRRTHSTVRPYTAHMGDAYRIISSLSPITPPARWCRARPPPRRSCRCSP